MRCPSVKGYYRRAGAASIIRCGNGTAWPDVWYFVRTAIGGRNIAGAVLIEIELCNQVLGQTEHNGTCIDEALDLERFQIIATRVAEFNVGVDEPHGPLGPAFMACRAIIEFHCVDCGPAFCLMRLTPAGFAIWHH